MFQIIIFLISKVTGLTACRLIADNISIYPTVGEKFIMPLQNLFGGNYNYSCIGCTQNITLWNYYNKLYQNTSQYTTQQLSSNGTHFSTLTTEQTINLYIYENSEMTLQCPIQIDSNLKCYNSMFTQSNNILIDCYDDNSLQFYYLKICEFVLFQTITNQNIPIKTKMMTFLSGKKIYLLYAQFYEQYQLLTVFQFSKSQLINLTTWNQEFQDFDVSNRFIYINFIGLLQQIYITSIGELSVLCSYNNTGIKIPISYIKVQTPIFFSSNSDSIFIVYYMGLNQFMLTFLAAQNGSISTTYTSNQFQAGPQSSKVQIFFTTQFLLIQVQNNIQFIEIKNFQLYNIDTILSSYPIQEFSYLDSYTNLFFLFSNQIVISQIKKNPELEVSFYNQIRLIPLIIEGYPFGGESWNNSCYLKITPYILNESDRNIYVTHSAVQEFYFLQKNLTYWQSILGFSGPLMKSTIKMLNQQLGISQDATFIPSNISFSYPFEVTGFSYIVKDGEEVFFVGSLNGDIYFYQSLNRYQCNLVYSDIGLYKISQIQIIFYFSSTIMVGINQGINDIRIYYFNVYFNGSTIVQFSNIVVYSFPAYKQFLFTFDNIIVLLQNQEIMIQSLTSSDQFTLGNEEIKTLFPNYDQKSIHFKPINIAINEVDLSSILFINNQNSVIIVVIQSTYEIIPYCILNVEFEIYQINIIVYQLIISYNCETLICFQVWNIMNLRKPDFVKNLPSISMLKGWNIVSDNIFLYVKSQVNTMYVYNPLLSYHSSLYYEFNFTGNYFSSIAMNIFYALLFLENQFFLLFTEVSQLFKPFTNFYDIQYIQQTLFNVYVENKYFSNQTTPNKLLSIINSLTEIQLPKNLQFQTTNHVPFILYLNPENLQNQSGSIVHYNLSQLENKTFCYLQNYIQFSNQDNSLSIQQIQPLWIFMIRTTLIIQFSQNNLNYFYSKETSGSNWINIYNGQNNQTDCSMPYVYQASNISQFSQMCLLNGSWYLTIFQFDQQSINVINEIVIKQNIEKVSNLMSINNNTIFFFSATISSEKEVIYITKNINYINNNSSSNITVNRNFCQQNNSSVYFTLNELKYLKNFYLIIYICQQEISYFVGTVNSEQEFVQYSVTQKLFRAPKFFSTKNIDFIEIQVLSQLRNQLILLLSTNFGPSFIFQASYFYKLNNRFRFHLVFDQIIQTIPPYGNYSLIYSQQILSGLLFFVYTSNIDKVYAIFDLTSVHKNITNPLLMKGGINLNLPLPISLAFNFTSIEEGGQFYELINQTINNYQVGGNAYIYCKINSKQNYTVNLMAYNSFSNAIQIITFYQDKYDWYIGLIIFLVIVILIASFLFWYKTRNIQEENSLLEELEMELE